MNGAQRRKGDTLEKSFPGCLGRMGNLFDLNTGIHSNKLLTHRPHYDDSLLSRSQSDVGSGASPPVQRPGMEEGMLKEVESKDNPPNIVAKLMGLDTLPLHQPYSTLPKIHKGEDLTMMRRKIELEDVFSEQSMQFQRPQSRHRSAREECKDMHENWQKSPESNCSIEKKMSLVRRKFMEAKRLATDDKLRQSKEFQDALEVLSSNGDVFVKFLQEPNSLFSKNQYEFHSIPPSPGSKRITVLRPSNAANFTGSTKKSDKTLKKAARLEQSYFPTMGNQRDDEVTVQPTRIVVLKPSRQKIHDIKNVVSQPHSSPGIVRGERFDKDDAEVSRRLAREITEKMHANLMRKNVSNVCSGNESSFHESENMGDPEFTPSSSRHSWDYVKRNGGPSSSGSLESSVSKEAKKRLSERWEIMASYSNAQEQKGSRRNSNTLGEMLALSETNISARSEDEDEDEDDDRRQTQRDSVPSLTCDMKQECSGNSPKNLLRSQSVPESSRRFHSKIRISKIEEKETYWKSSLKDKVSRLLFAGNKKLSEEEEAYNALSADEILGLSAPHTTTSITNDNGLEGRLSVGSSADISSDLKEMRHQNSITFHEKGSAIAKHIRPAQDHPSPISVPRPPFDSITQEPFGYVRPGFQHPMKSMIDKSPRIESVARTLPSDDACLCASAISPFQAPSVSSRTEEERNFLLSVQTLLTMAGIETNSFPLQCHSLETRLNPALREKYASLDSKEPLHEATRRELRSRRTLVFDCVVAALLDVTDKGPDYMLVSIDGILEKMKKWFDSEARSFIDDEDGDSGSAVVERVVREKVIGKEWAENLKIERENLGREIEVKLLEELVVEAVTDFAHKT